MSVGFRSSRHVTVPPLERSELAIARTHASDYRGRGGWRGNTLPRMGMPAACMTCMTCIHIEVPLRLVPEMKIIGSTLEELRLVPRDGVEPPTRGSSVPRSTN